MADQYISPFVSNGDTFRSANKTSYDLTNTQPAGGPINDPESGFTHTYTPNNKYLDSFDVRASNNSNFGVTELLIDMLMLKIIVFLKKQN